MNPNTNNPRIIVDEYLEAFYTRNANVTDYLAPDLRFIGPAVSFDNAAAFLKASAHATRAVKGIEKQHVFVDETDVCVFYELLLDHQVSRVSVAEWYHLRDGRISSIRSVMDTAPFMKRASSNEATSAIDPVCGMSVEMSTAAATRSHEGTTYYFCNVGCAEAFEGDPKQYVSAF